MSKRSLSVVVIVLCTLGSFAACNRNPAQISTPTPPPESPEVSMARTISQEVMKQVFPAPIQLKFSDRGRTPVTSLGGSQYSVSGWVEFKDESGQSVRRSYQISLQPKDDGTWHAEEVKLLD